MTNIISHLLSNKVTILSITAGYCTYRLLRYLAQKHHVLSVLNSIRALKNKQRNEEIEYALNEIGEMKDEQKIRFSTGQQLILSMINKNPTQRRSAVEVISAFILQTIRIQQKFNPCTEIFFRRALKEAKQLDE
jgi:hypothetical protein